jgi:hypothetical protein
MWLERKFREHMYAKFHHSPGLKGLVVMLVFHGMYLS